MSDLPPPAVPPRRRIFPAQWLLLALALALLGAQMGWSVHESRARIEAEAQSRLENHSLVLAGAVERQLRAIDAALHYLRDHGPAHLAQPGWIIHLNDELATMAKVRPAVRTLFLFDAKGTVIAASRPELVGRDFGEREHFQALQRQPRPDRLHVGQPYVSALKAFTVGLTRPVYGPRGEFAGIAGATLDVDNLREMMAAQHPLPGTRLTVAHGDGTLLTLFPARPGAEPGKSIDAPGSHFRQHRDSGRPASLFTGKSLLFGKDVILSARSVQPAALAMDAPLVVAAGRDLDDILAPWRDEVRHYFAYFCLIATGAALALWFHQRRQRGFARRIEAQEAATRHALLMLQRFIDHLPGLAYVKDAGFRTLMANRGFRILLGMEPAAMIGKTTQELFPGAFGEKITADDQALLASGQTVTIEESFGGRDYETTKFIIEDGQRMIGGVTLDVTARKTAERALVARMAEQRELNRQLEDAHGQLLQAEKMASIGQLAAGVAHEINNPIGFIGSNLGTLRNYLRDILEVAETCERTAAASAHPDDFAPILAAKAARDFDYLKTDVFHLLAECADGLQRVKKIVQDLKDFSRPGEATWQWADLHAGLDSTLNIVWNELKYKCEVKKEYGELPPVWCVPSQLNQVFMNLLTNAGHAIAGKGTIAIRSGRRDDMVWIAVADTGAGIAPENLKRIFDPFFTTKPVGKGTGLGLSLSYGIVEKHRGRIEVRSEPGEGATFTVWLPIGEADAASAAPMHPADAASAAPPAPSIGEPR